MAVLTLGLKKTSMCDVGAFIKMDSFYSSSVKTVAMYFLKLFKSVVNTTYNTMK